MTLSKAANLPMSTPMPMRIIGIDPGLRVTGFGIIDRYNDHDLRYVSSGVIKSDQTELPKRLHDIFTSLMTVIEQHRPNCAAIEKVFVNVNPQSTLLLGQARGAALVALTQSIPEVHEYTALQLKQSVVGYGRATKEQMQEMVQRLLHLSNTPSTDAADALGMAITHAHSLSYLQHISASTTSTNNTLFTARSLRRGRRV